MSALRLIDPETIKLFLIETIGMPAEASDGEALVLMTQLAETDCAEWEAYVAQLEEQIERLTEALVRLGIGTVELDLLCARRARP